MIIEVNFNHLAIVKAAADSGMCWVFLKYLRTVFSVQKLAKLIRMG